MSEEGTQMSIRILDKEYQVSCPANERQELIDSAELLNSAMREIRDGGKVVGLDRIGVMAGLNLANELLKYRSFGEQVESNFSFRLKSIRERVESAISKGQQLEL